MIRFRAARDVSLEKPGAMDDDVVRAELSEPDTEDYGLITRYLAGELSPVDRERVAERLRTDPEFRALAEPIITIWKVPLPLDREPDRIDEMQAEAAVQKFRERVELKKLGVRKRTVQERHARSRRYRRAFVNTIGGMLTAALVYWIRPQLFPSPSFYLHVDAPVDVAHIARLPDETEVTLTPGSHLTYSRLFSRSDERTLNIDGMGTFVVAPGTRKALTVAGAGVEVRASEGRFTIVAYNAMPIAFVRVDEGRAEVRARTLYGTGHALILHAGQGARVGPGLQIDRAEVPIAAADIAEPATRKERPAPAAKDSATKKDSAVPQRPVRPETALADAIARDFGERPREVVFGKRDMINVLFWKPAFWQSYMESTEFPRESLPVVGQSATHVAQFVWRTYGRKAGFKVVRIVFIRVIRDQKLVDPTHEKPAQEVSALFTAENLETGQPEKPMLGMVQCEEYLCRKAW